MPGDVLDGRWKVLERIGYGSSGSVFQGEDLKEDRQVAIKLLAPDHCRRPDAIARFEREARVLTTLQHPNLVRLLGLGKRGEVPYIVMEFLEGITLERHRQHRRGSLHLLETLRITQQICGALDFLHRNDIVHRDVKPQNLFIGPKGRATLLDLGVVRDLAAPALTLPGAMVGTPYYMAPEQTRVEAKIDRRTDVYAMAAVVFELLTGRPPFDGRSNFEVLHAHRNTPPPDACAQVPAIPPAAGALLKRALAKNAAERPPTAGVFLAELEAALGLDDERTHEELHPPSFEEEPGPEEPTTLEELPDGALPKG